jgi:hypothetical protein
MVEVVFHYFLKKKLFGIIFLYFYIVLWVNVKNNFKKN